MLNIPINNQTSGTHGVPAASLDRAIKDLIYIFNSDMYINEKGYLQKLVEILFELECRDIAVLDDDGTAGVGEDIVNKSLLSGIQFPVDAEQNRTLNGVGTVQDVLFGESYVKVISDYKI